MSGTLSSIIYPALADSMPVSFRSQNLTSELALRLPADLRGAFSQVLYLKERLPAYTVVEARKALERVLRDVCAREGLRPRRKSSLYALIGLCQTQGFVPELVITHALTVRNYGNAGAHDSENSEALTSESVEPCLMALAMILKWYTEEYQ